VYDVSSSEMNEKLNDRPRWDKPPWS